jgi:hypothetical protein
LIDDVFWAVFKVDRVVPRAPLLDPGVFTIFAVVDALTRLSQQSQNAGERLEVDQQAASLLNLVSVAPPHVDATSQNGSLAVAT